MKIDHEDITNGSIVWITDFRFNKDDITKKPIRHVPPTKVLVRSNKEIKRQIYYSPSHFVGLNKDDKPIKSKIYPVFDNTGFRAYSGHAVSIFDCEDDAVREYRYRCDKNIALINTEKSRLSIQWNAEIVKIKMKRAEFDKN